MSIGPRAMFRRFFSGLRLLRLRVWAMRAFWRAPGPVASCCKLLDEKDLVPLRGWTQRMMAFDRALLSRLADKRLRGLRAWEYGVLLDFMSRTPESTSWRVLDVGPGNSVFPGYLRGRVASLTTIDYADPLEPPNSANETKLRGWGVTATRGSMLELPDAAGTYDLVTCVSVIEHLDDRGDGTQVPYQEFIALTRRGLREMLRVIKPGGYLFLTTDAYIPGLQGIDNWSRNRRPFDVIWSAYRIEDIEATFLDCLRADGFELVGQADYGADVLRDDPARSSYRGRYFTTFAVLARKPAG